MVITDEVDDEGDSGGGGGGRWNNATEQLNWINILKSAGKKRVTRLHLNLFRFHSCERGREYPVQ